MAERVIPLADHRYLATAPAIPATLAAPTGLVLDRLQRPLHDLRISVTDRCNFRCSYCMPKEVFDKQYSFLPHSSLLSFEEIARLAALFVAHGVRKIRLTGGEPLLRKGLVELVEEVSKMRPAFDPGGRLDIALTTNGHLLEDLAAPLQRAGLNRITVSMDAVDPEIFARITRVPGSYDRVLRGVRAAQAAGLGPVKVNAVLLRGCNDDQIEACANFSREENVNVRLSEWMPLEEGRSWTPETVVTMDEIVTRLNAYRPLVDLPPNHASETARRFTFDDGRGEIGIIAPVSRPFCGHCSRVRLTSDGKVRTCLFSQSDHDLLGLMRRGATDDEMAAWIRAVVMGKEARHHIGEPGFLKPSRSMVHIGG